MHPQETDRLIADLLAFTLKVTQHLHEGRRLTPLQGYCLVDTVASLSHLLTAWKIHEHSLCEACEAK